MWTYVAPWLVQTGEVPPLRVGDRIERLGVRALWWSVEAYAGDEPDALVELSGPDPSGEATPHYGMTGTVTWSQEPASLVLDLGPVELLAEPRSVHVVPGPGSAEPPEPAASLGSMLEVGARVRGVVSLAAMVDFETEAGGYPDLRRPWVVHAIRVEHRELVWLDGGASRAGAITSVDDIDEMLRWSDLTRKEFGSYLLDVSPLPG